MIKVFGCTWSEMQGMLGTLESHTAEELSEDSYLFKAYSIGKTEQL